MSKSSEKRVTATKQAKKSNKLVGIIRDECLVYDIEDKKSSILQPDFKLELSEKFIKEFDKISHKFWDMQNVIFDILLDKGIIK